MTKGKLSSIVVALTLALVATTVSAQSDPPLTAFVNDESNGATDLQREAGMAIQRTCGALAADGGFALQGPEGDLFLRCNEMVATAAELGGTGQPGRSLGIDEGGLLAAIQQVSGEELHAQSSLSTRVSNGQFSNIAGRLNSLRVGGASVAAGGPVAFADPLGSDRPAGAGMSGFSMSGARGGGASADVAGSRLGWFLDGSYNTGDRDHTVNEDGFDFDAASVTAGLDWSFDSGVIGISAGYDAYEADFGTVVTNSAEVVSGGNVEVSGTTGSLFGAWYLGNFYLDGIVSFGSLDSEVSRNLQYDSESECVPACPDQDRTLTGEPDGDFVAGGFTTGYDAAWGNWDVATTLSLNYREIDIDGYDETDSQQDGGLALRYAPQTIESLRSILGFAFTRNISRDFGVLSPQLRVEWHHEFEDDPLTIAAKYVVEDTIAGPASVNDFTASCISCFRFSTDEIDTDFGLVGLGVSMVFARRLQLYAVYDALIGLDNLTSHSIGFGLRGQF